MKYYIIKSRDVYIIFDEFNNIIFRHLTILEAQNKIKNVECIDFIQLLMTDY